MLLFALPVFLTVLFVVQDLAHGAYPMSQRAVFAAVVLLSFVLGLKGINADRKGQNKR